MVLIFRIANIQIYLEFVVIILLSVTLNITYCQSRDSIRFEKAIFLEAGTVVTPGSDKDAFGNFIAGVGYEQEIAAGRLGSNVVSILLEGGFGFTYLDIQGGLQFATRVNIYMYAGAQLMMYYELGSKRDLIYDKYGYLKHQPDRIIIQILPNIGLGINAEDIKIELITSLIQPMEKLVTNYFVFRAYFKI